MSAKGKAAAMFGEGTMMRKSAADLSHAATPRLAVRFAALSSAAPFLAEPDSILGVVGFGAERPAFLPDPCPFVSAPLAPAAGGAARAPAPAGAERPG